MAFDLENIIREIFVKIGFLEASPNILNIIKEAREQISQKIPKMTFGYSRDYSDFAESRRNFLRLLGYGGLAIGGSMISSGCAEVIVSKELGLREPTVGFSKGAYIPDDFNFTDIEGKEHKFVEYKRKKDAMVILFAEAWCRSCQSQAWTVNQLYKNTRDLNVEFFAISKKDANTLRGMYNFPIYGGRTATVGDIPAAFLTETNGLIIDFQVGSLNLNILWKNRIREMSNKKIAGEQSYQKREAYTPSLEVLNVRYQVEDNTVYLEIRPKGDAKIVANTEFTITPLKNYDINFFGRMPIVHRGNGEYYSKPLKFNIPFKLNNGTMNIDFKINYAYCVGNQCYEGQKVFSVPLR